MNVLPTRTGASLPAWLALLAAAGFGACGGGEIAVHWESQVCGDDAGDGVGLPVCASDTDCPASPTACIVGRCLPAGSASRCAWVLVPDGAACDDGQACAGPDTCKAGKCQGAHNLCACKTHADCQKLDDGNLCNGGLYCDTSGATAVCKTDFSTAVTCPLGSACQPSFCDPKSGACTVLALDAAAGNPAPCDDGNPCTGGDQCAAGKCAPGKVVCECLSDAECGDDGDLCNGAMYCDKAVFPFACKVNPATVVSCPTGLDTECAKNLCEPKTGQCFVQLATEGSPCSDGDSCTGNDFCVAGSCAPGKSVCPCNKQADCVAFEDGDLCNGTLYCDLAAAVPGCKVNPATVVDCPSGADTMCQANQCDKKSGKCGPVAKPAGTVCDDNNLCTASDLCESGVCKSGANTCACTEDADCGKHEDGNLCNGTLYCDKSKLPFACAVNPGTVVQCSSGNDTACSAHTCDPKLGQCKMVAKPDGLACDADGFACTKGDTCKAGVCAPGANVCKCEQNADCLKNEDGNLCNGTLYCDKAQQPFVCAVNPKTLVVCKTVDDSACLANQCQPKSGQCQMTPVHQGEPCDADGDVCTTGDACHLGVCQAGTNTCQCTADADCAKYDDGNLCNGTLHCDKSAAPFLCKVDPKSPVVCPAEGDLPCVKNQCQAKTGQCQATPLGDGKACDDGNPCTHGDVCTKGACAGKVVCACEKDSDCAAFDDGDLCNGTWGCVAIAGGKACQAKSDAVSCPPSQLPCMAIQCEPKSGQCKAGVDLAQDGTACDDKDGCTVATTCKTGACVGSAKDCDDKNGCTSDSCALGKCLHAPLPGAPCDDGNSCTQKDACANGQCAGSSSACSDNSTCTTDTCDATKGCVFVPLAQGATCSDGEPCTLGDACNQGVCVGKTGCDDSNACTDDACMPNGCMNLPNANPCEDGNACTVNDLCLGGKCSGGAGVVCATVGCGPEAQCDPKTGCPAADAAATCNIQNFCVDVVCDDMLGCLGVPKAVPPQCGSGATKTSACKYGTCPTCKAYSLAIEASGVDYAYGGMALDGTDVWMVGTAGAGPKTSGWFAKVAPDKSVMQGAHAAGPSLNTLHGVVSLSGTTMLAAGQSMGDPSVQMQGWLLAVGKADLGVGVNKVLGGPGDDGFAGLLATSDLPIAFGFSDDQQPQVTATKGWLARVKADLTLATTTHQLEAGYDIEWRAATTGGPTAAEFYVGVATDYAGITRPVVGAYKVQTLDKVWLTVLDVKNAEAYGVTYTAKGITAVGVLGAGFAAQGWVGRLDPAGKLVHQVTEQSKGARAYQDVAAALSGDVMVAGGAEPLALPFDDLTSHAWIVSWNLAQGSETASGTAHLGVQGEQMFKRILPYGSGYLLGGELLPTGGKRKAWLLQLDGAGKWVCQP
ncbi:MAG: hypothetical protein FJ100_15320 [Deltaproteobacteria bacterium]|nr:hypothetical protein [Deltaproteobacteria bacterium]